MLHELPPVAEIPFAGPGSYSLGAAIIDATSVQGTSQGFSPELQYLPSGFETDCVLRTRKPGDWIRPFGMNGMQSLQDYFVNHKIDAPFRDHVPLLCKGSEVLWVAGVGGGHVPDVRVHPSLYLLSLSGEHPWCTHPTNRKETSV